VTLSTVSTTAGAGDVTAWITGATAGSVTVVVKASDGSTTQQTATANSAGMATATIATGSLSTGLYSVEVTSGSAKAGSALNIK
jgi:hypothetical protein